MTSLRPLNNEQQLAITTRNASILVSAPAGSGKTKILVSRILALLEEGYHIDELLVLTFTNAAAAEMKQRLQQDLDKRIQQSNNRSIKQHLLLQQQKLPIAYITNFHGFCSTLLKQYGYMINIPSSFEILSEPHMIQNQILDACISNWLNEECFQTFITTNFNTYHFNDFKSLLLKIYTLSHNYMDFKSYQNTLKETIYQPIISKENIDTWCLSSYLLEILKNKVIEGRNKVIELHSFCHQHGLTFFYQNPYDSGKQSNTPSPYDCFIKYFSTLTNMLEQNSLQAFIDHGIPKLDRSYNARFDDETSVYKKEYTAKRTSITKGITTAFETLLYTDINEFSAIMDRSYQTLDTLFILNKRFKKAYQNYKLEHALLDFNDLEDYAHALLEPQYHIVDTLYQQLKEIMIDEYQDTNDIQETLIQKISNHQQPNIPCFMVGDMKQSIYKFRGGDPEIFNQKYLTYNNIATTKRIDLKYNYRSNKIILDSVNYICNQIMDTSIGGLAYYEDDSAKLNYDYLRKEGAKSLDQEETITNQTKERLTKENRFTTEILLLEKNKVIEDITTAEKEAMAVAKRINELVGDFILDDYKVGTRVTNYKDIVVLMRSTAEFITFKKIFDRYQIPNQIVLSTGFLQTQEVINSIHVLRAIDNHLDNIAMVSLLKGNYTCSHFSEELLVAIRSDTSISIYDNLLVYIKNQGKDYQKVESFINYYHTLVSYSRNHSVKETLTKFYQDSQYPLFVSSLINGKQRYSNLSLLLEQLSLETDPLHTVVMSYMEKIEQGINLSPGQVVSTNSNTVSFMTIHKSKGLEFPIVFISQLHKQFNQQDTKARMVIDKHLGVAITPRVKQNLKPYQNVSIEYPNKYRNLIANVQTKELIDEEMRIFYVALTRASQKLILTGAVKEFSTLLRWQQNIMDNEDPEMMHTTNDTVILYRNLRNTITYLEWLGLSIIRHPNIINQCKSKEFYYAFEENDLLTLKQNADTIAIYPNPNNHFFNTEHAKFHLSLLTDDMLDFEVPTKTKSDISLTKYHQYASYSYLKENKETRSIAVTKKIKDGDRTFNDVHYEEDTSTTKANDRGTLIHSILEQLPISHTIDLDQTLTNLYNQYTEEQIALIEAYKPHLQDFIHSEIYQWFLDSDHVYKEKAFTLKEENGQIIHGIFDAMIIKDNTITIVDYKTDRVAKNTTKDTLIQLHKPQMDYYIKVMKILFPNKDIQAVVYYLYINTYVTV
jgi:ATP-dependent helicase/nuclease subunit A